MKDICILANFVGETEENMEKVALTALRGSLKYGFAYWWAVAFGVLFFVSYDSFTHDLYYRCDSAWFFMCGKAWMNGLIPYVDFADSKGPLLWLIYGVGYLIDNDSYIGMFWIETVFYAVTLLYAYKTARIWLSPHKSAIAAALLPIALFCPVVHTEMRAEDFCHPFQMIALYYLLECLYNSENFQKRAAFACGFCVGACMMIKWNIAAMSIILFVFLLWHCRKRWIAVLQAIAMFLIGFLVVALPFGVYFCFIDGLRGIAHEYFIAAYTANSADGLSNALCKYFCRELPAVLLFKSPLVSLFAYATLIGSIIFGLKQKHSRFVPVVICLWYLAIIVRVGNYYYYDAMGNLAIFLIIFVLNHIKFERYAKQVAVVTAVCMPFVVALENGEFWRRHFLCNDPYSQKVYWEIAYKLSVVENPTIMNSFHENGVSTPVNGLPAARYWGYIVGRQDTHEPRLQYIKDNIPQFVLIQGYEPNDSFRKVLTDNGYIMSYSAKTPIGTVGAVNEITQELYRRSDVPDIEIPKDFKITVWDVLLKRNPIKRYKEAIIQ